MLSRIAGAAALAVVFAAPGHAGALEQGSPEDAGMSSGRLERLSAELQEYVDEERLAGAVVVVARRGKIVYQEAFGDRDREAESRMQPDAIFRIASQSKAIVTAAALILQEEGALLLSDPVGKYLPEFMETTVAVPQEDGSYDIVPAKRPVTIRDLLMHTSGYSYGESVATDLWQDAGIHLWYFADRDEPIGDTVSRMAALPAAAQPGEAWVYGYSTDILGALIERASGQTLDDYLRERILEPLAMHDTHFYLPTAKRDRLAVVYAATPEGLERAPEDGLGGQGAYVDGPRKSFSGGAGLLSTAGDYARFLQMLLNGGELDGQRVLSRKSVELMTADHLGDLEFVDNEGFGFGFYIVRELGGRTLPGSIGEYGWGGAYHSQYWVDPREQMVVVHMTQLYPTGGVDDQSKVRALVYQAIVD